MQWTAWHNIDKDERLIAYAMTPLGKCLLLIYFIFLLSLTTHYWPAMAAALIPSTFFPKKRALWILIGTLLFLPYHPTLSWNLNHASLLTRTNVTGLCIAYALAIAYLLFLHHIKRLKHPLGWMLAVIIAAIMACHHLSIGQQPLIAAMIFSTLNLVWFVAYSLQDIEHCQTKQVWKQIGLWLPFWRSTLTPIPKGWRYVRSIEQHDPRAIASLQLNALRLLLYSFVIYALLTAVQTIQTQTHSLTMPALLTLYQSGHSANTAQVWGTMVFDFIEQMLWLTLIGNLIIATVRMMGYKALRNTYKPLRSQTIAEFWNRYYYYFKELLVEFFFYPCFFRVFKKHPRLRLVTATYAAVFGGNVLYHLLKHPQRLLQHPPTMIIAHIMPYTIYAFILATAISLSQWRTQKPTTSCIKRRLVRPTIVLSFFCILGIFNVPYETNSILVNWHVFLALFGIQS